MIKIVTNINKLLFILYLFFCLNKDVYSIDNKNYMLKDRLTDMEYYTSLVEFTAGLLVILCLALIVLLIINARKNKLKSRQIRHYEQHQDLMLQKDGPAGTAVFTQSETGRETSGKNIEMRAMNVESLEKEIEALRNKLWQEQELRKKMENEVAELLSRMKGA